ncbi:hypothetical protein DFH09DRAFT_1138360 [Mycena vulgaris]|nr:hypothetical protein DFH09DRAFT_1138360 [Mycena vulgaris]
MEQKKAPIFSLPTELVVAIVATAQDDRVPVGLDEIFKSEWTMSHICRRFRNIIISAPTLWTLIEADLCSTGSVEIFKMYLERSQGCKIWATVREDGLKRHGIAEHLSHIFPHTPRIRRLDIMGTNSSMAAMLASFGDVAVPSLECLQIKRDEEYSSYPLWRLFSAGPPIALTSLKLVGFTPDFPVPQWTASLTHLELRRGRDVENSDENGFFMEIARQCPFH